MYVYFIQAGEHGPIKIGLTEDVEHRRHQLQTGNAAELQILAVIPGTARLESALHDRFAPGQLRGEWFAPDTPGLDRAIARAIQAEAVLAVTERGLCNQCGLWPVMPPRTRLCSDDCERARRLATSARWRLEHPKAEAV